MVFSSLLFLFRYLPVMLILYYAAPRRLRNGVLFLGSLFFYGWGEPVYISLMLFSSLVDYTHGLAISRMQQRGERKKARLAVASSAVINLSLLGFFKYSGFLTETLNGWLGTSIPVPELALPMLQYLSRTVRILSHHVGSASLPAQQRIARYLLDQPMDPDGRLSCTHEEIGQGVGASRVTVSRVLGQLTREGILQTGYGALRILDPRRLRRLAEPLAWE